MSSAYLNQPSTATVTAQTDNQDSFWRLCLLLHWTFCL